MLRANNMVIILKKHNQEMSLPLMEIVVAFILCPLLLLYSSSNCCLSSLQQCPPLLRNHQWLLLRKNTFPQLESQEAQARPEANATIVVHRQAAAIAGRRGFRMESVLLGT